MMTSTCKIALFMGAAVVALSQAPAASAAVSLLPHRAVYDLSLADSNGQSGISSVRGRMVMEFSGGACEGYTTNFRFVLTLVDSESKDMLTDLRTTTFESPEGNAFSFLSQTYTNDVLTQEVKGAASKDGGNVRIQLQSPADRTVDLAPAVVFPTQNLRDLISAAQAGENLLEAKIFDGVDDGDRASDTTAIIGAAKLASHDGPAARLAGMKHWPVSVSYFDPAVHDDKPPEYTVAFDLYANGVADDLMLDYGDFKLAGRMASLETLPKDACD
ncbi:hypothetical protein HDIA_2473 [Hartmannibacter diazotrophicus]|uniref:Secreted protein n=1 Tax=Hartmannibacter diazotrophicus TaxID=1482074 RepID=A0A2C9D6Q7_9HYPH|nr:cell envelope integrity EipB family protein [Hartmannibacter diazotrophicus]SON56014.1 hypothetical protein HDIA_2473 [Hartmannibacter diazotrophicus]